MVSQQPGNSPKQGHFMKTESRLDTVRKTLKQHTLPSISLKPIAELAEYRWSSKFGGMPYWPKEMPYPKSNQVGELVLLAQLNFEELPTLEGYPESGLLQFFIDTDDDCYGMDFDQPLEEMLTNPNGHRVIYHETVITSEAELAANLPQVIDDGFMPLTREYRLEATLVNDMPSPVDYRYDTIIGDPLDLDDDLSDQLFDEFVSEGSKVGGYANFTQQDPRGRAEGNWLLLFQMDSEYGDDIDIMWGDSGVSNFFIEETALGQKDFSRIWYNWDCC